MNKEILKVNSKTSTLEWKRKFNKLLEHSTVKIETSNIETLNDEELSNLKCGDVVCKITGNQRHCYIVTYKEENHGICLSYFAAGYSETVSYDYIGGHWVFNSIDKIETQEKLVSGQNIKKINNVSLLGSSNIITPFAPRLIHGEDEVIAASNNELTFHISDSEFSKLNNEINLLFIEVHDENEDYLCSGFLSLSTGHCISYDTLNATISDVSIDFGGSQGEKYITIYYNSENFVGFIEDLSYAVSIIGYSTI